MYAGLTRQFFFAGRGQKKGKKGQIVPKKGLFFKKRKISSKKGKKRKKRKRGTPVTSASVGIVLPTSISEVMSDR